MIRILILILFAFEINAQCIRYIAPLGIPITPTAISISLSSDIINRRTLGTFTISISNIDTTTGDFVQLVIEEIDGNGDVIGNLVNVKFAKAGQIGSDYFDDSGNNWQNNFLPFINSADLTDQMIGNLSFQFNKYTWALANGYDYTSGMMVGANWVSPAKRLKWSIGFESGNMDRSVDLFQGYIGRNFNGGGGAEHYTFVNQRGYVGTPPDVFNLTSLIVTQDGNVLPVSSNFNTVFCNLFGRVHDVCVYRPSNGQPNINDLTSIGYTMNASFSNGMVSSNFGRNMLSAMGITGNNESQDNVSSMIQYSAQIESNASTSFKAVAYGHFVGIASPITVDLVLDGVNSSYPLTHNLGTSSRYSDEFDIPVSVIGNRYNGSLLIPNPSTSIIDSRLDFQYELNYVY